MNVFAIICLLALFIDRIIGDPEWLPHPVRWIGRLISLLENKYNRNTGRVWKGAVLSLAIILIVYTITFAIVWGSYQIHYALGVFVEVILIAVALAQKSLKDAAMVVYNRLKLNDLKEARVKLGWIVGRDTHNLEEDEIVRGVVETVSENTSDGVTAPLFYALLFGAPGIWVYKTINTLDSMIGYKNERFNEFGRFAARLDDIVNFIPSRITGLLILFSTRNQGKYSLKKRILLWYRDAKKHPSPNSGYLEAATAYQLGIRLGGFNSYGGKQTFRAYMGEPIEILQKKHILASIQHMYTVSLFFTLIVGGVIYAISLAWR
ncbi:adenosylcobinamide-phosphate synthase CbiB [Lysinibacillus telephonicus]|uniref:adenosylcobinamide-phosphate synthase CbiB n=1 Tax=Lysinibacillus telephonicus TaxID=1714840 RepID=UPI003978B61C